MNVSFRLWIYNHNLWDVSPLGLLQISILQGHSERVRYFTPNFNSQITPHMDVFLIGAGASKAYDQSPTGCRMPLAREVFSTFEKLDISDNPWVLIGKILNYARDKKNIPLETVFKRNYDIETFHSEVEADLNASIARRGGQHGLTPEIIELNGVFTQLAFFFSSVINEIQNGPPSPAHCSLVSQLDPNDCIITFNWDTLIDRALHHAGNWELESGYGFSPREIFRDEWLLSSSRMNPKAAPRLLKLHGSSNWITSYAGIDIDGHKPYLIQNDPNDTVRIFEFATKPYACYAGRYMDNYQPFSYGYYPPNITSDVGKSAPPGMVFVSMRPKFPFMPEGVAPNDGIPSMPLIIPPVKNKSYELFGALFRNLWQEAERALIDCERIFVIGYSFPETDVRSIELFKRAFVANLLPALVPRFDMRSTIGWPHEGRFCESPNGLPKGTGETHHGSFSSNSALDSFWWDILEMLTAPMVAA